MRCIAVTFPGLESVTQEEIKAVFHARAKKLLPGRLLFSLKERPETARLRSVTALYEYVDHFKFTTLPQILTRIRKLDVSRIEEPFMVRCHRTGDHPFRSQEAEREAGAIIYHHSLKVSLSAPKTIVYLDVFGKYCLVGLLLGENLSRRAYRLHTHNASINAALAFALVKMADVKKDQILVDPFCKDGVIPIEAALAGGRKVYGFDESLHTIRGARVNARLAKVEVELSKYDVSWLDTKFPERGVDVVVTSPPFPSKRRKEEDVRKLYQEFFYQLRYILKKKGRVVVVSPQSTLLKQAAAQMKFRLVTEFTVQVKQLPLAVLIWTA